MKLVVSDAHEGIKASVSTVLTASWRRCRFHFIRNALAHAGKSGRRVVSAFIATAFAQDDAAMARTQWRSVWPAAGFGDTERRCFMKPEVGYGEASIQSGVQG